MKKTLLVLDLDESLLHSIKDDEEGYGSTKMEYIDMGKYFRVHFRPYYRVLLQFLFKHYDVAIWSAGTEQYVDFIVKRLEKVTRKKFKFVWSVDMCEKSLKKYRVTKALELLKEYPNVIIVDDNPEIKEKYPKQTIAVRPYEEPVYDEELLRVLKKLKEKRHDSSSPPEL
jgi:TFIIF-interacting CTD phosphatase-like protein